MSNVPRFEPRLATTGRGERGEVVASFGTYAEAERAVDHLADSQFPVEEVEIVGRDVRLVEQVTGRLTLGRTTAAGAGTGAWWGLFIGLLIGLFTTGSAWLWIIVGAVLIGAAWGAIFGFVAQWAMRGRRDFSSAQGLVAGRYDVTVSTDYVDRARQLLSGLR